MNALTWIGTAILGLAVGAFSMAAGQTERLMAATTDGKKIVIKPAGGSCTLDSKDVRRRIGLNATGPAAQKELAALAVLPAFVVPDRASDRPGGASPSRLVIIDLACNETQSLAKYSAEPAESWYGALAEAVKLGYMDIRRQEDGKWGSWNLRTNRWDPEPCCSMPAHSATRAAAQRAYDRQHAPSEPPWPVLWDLLQPAVWVYAAVVAVCFFVALGKGFRGPSIIPQALVVLPLKAIWLAAVLVVVANLYALAGVIRSGALAAVAAGAYQSATRAMRK